MQFEMSDRGTKYAELLQAFIDEKINPAEPVYAQQMRDSGDPHFYPPVLDELKSEAKELGLWKLAIIMQGVLRRAIAEPRNRAAGAPQRQGAWRASPNVPTTWPTRQGSDMNDNTEAIGGSTWTSR